jgi:DNA-binding response OmpR family regulator
MGLVDLLDVVTGHPSRAALGATDVAVLEDDPQMAELAVEMCGRMGLTATTHVSPAAFLDAAAIRPPRVAILDWRLERELGAGAFLAVRHRFGDLPIVCWTSTPIRELPAMLTGDARVRIVDKSAGVDAFEAAVRWALDRAPGPGRTNGGLDR